MHKPSKEQIEEWTENPVTIYFKDRVEDELEYFSSHRGLDVFHPFEAQKTQEVLANFNGSVDSLSWVLRLVEGELAEDEEVD